jgi:hypothetical protein
MGNLSVPAAEVSIRRICQLETPLLYVYPVAVVGCLTTEKDITTVSTYRRHLDSACKGPSTSLTCPKPQIAVIISITGSGRLGW